MTIPLYAQTAGDYVTRQAATTVSTTTSLLILAFILLVIVAMWRVFERAGEPGWAVLIPIYNMYVMTKVGGVSGWWVVVMFIPLINIIALFVVSIAVARRFDRGAGFGIGLALLPMVFYPILAWGDEGPVAGAA
jgi:TRAP-type C4-dicarboxylate transport system permease small subunit